MSVTYSGLPIDQKLEEVLDIISKLKSTGFSNSDAIEAAKIVFNWEQAELSIFHYGRYELVEHILCRGIVEGFNRMDGIRADVTLNEI